MEFSLLFAAFMAVGAVYVMLRWEGKRGNAADCTKDLWDIALMAGLAGVLVGRLAAMITAGVNPVTHPADIIIVRSGVATGWASVTAIGVVAWQARTEFWIVADGLSAAALAGLAGWHAGCLARDSCLGTASDLPWALTQPGSDISRHPVELYTAGLYAVVAVAVALWKANGRPPLGVPAATALATAGFVRLLTEPLRPSLLGEPVTWYLAAVVIGVAVGLWRWWLGQRSRRRATA
jgi:prolipoprotein diacylglyceryltransferase